MDIESIKNTVIQWDCLEVMKQLPDKCIDLVLTDPPYGMSYVSSRRNIKHEEIEQDDNLDWVSDWMKDLYRVQKDDTHAYIFCNDYGLGIFREEAKKAGYTVKRTLVWIKNNHTSGDLEWDYANITEFCIFLHKGRRLLKGKRENNLLKFDRENTDDHPTVKNKEMMKYLIDKSSEQGEIVFDPFAGSGTTGAAALEIHRQYILIEKEPKYIEIINKRLENITPSLF